MTVTREQMKDLAETYDESIYTLLSFSNDDYTRDEMIVLFTPLVENLARKF